MKLKIKAGTTSKRIKVFIQDSSATTGAGLTGLVFNTASLTAYYIKDGDSATTVITLVTATLGTYTSGGFKEVDATNMPGVYEIGIPNAAIASGNCTHIFLRGAANMAQLPIEIELDAVDYQDGVRFGLTALPNVASGSAGALLTSGTGAAQLATTSGLVTLAGVTHTGAVIPTVSDVTTKTGYSLSAGGVQAIWDALTSALTTVGSIGKLFVDNINATISSRSTYAGGDTAGTATLLSRIASALTITGGKVTVGTNDDKTGYSLVATTGLGNQTANISGSITSVTNAIVLPTIPIDWITASGIATDAIGSAEISGAAVAKIQNGLATPTNITAASGITVSAIGANVITEASIADGAINRATFASDTGLQNIRSGTAQAGAGTSITLDAGASATNNFYNNAIVYITGGTGAGQARFCTAYDGTTKVATVTAWTTNPNATSTFSILPFDSIPGASAPTAAAVADAVWDEALSGHLSAGSTGEKLNAAGASGDPWSAALPGAYGAGTAGNIIGSNLNATVSSRSTYAGGDTAGTTTLLSRIGSAITISGGSVTVGTNNDKTGYALAVAPPTLAQIEASTVLAKEVTVGTVPGLVWSQLTTATWPTDSFGKQVVIGASTQRAISISGSGSGHVACVVHDAEPNSIPEDAFVTGALSARALAADAATEIATAVSGIQILSRLDSMVESNGGGQFRFDTIALSLAPSGGGGGGTVNITVEDSSITIG